MMDFLRSLAPSAATDASRAVAVLPSRYADSGPLPGSSPASAAQTEDVVVPAEARVAFGSRVTHAQIAPDETPPARIAERLPGSDRAAAIAPQAQPADERLRDAHRTPAAAPAFSALERSVPAASGEGVRTAARNAGEALRPVAVERIVTIAASTEPHATRAPIAASPAAPYSTARPLSEAAVATTAARDAPPAVIHLEIDRIEIRAPAAPQRPAPVAKTRASTSSVSLSDYLRTRASARGKP